MSNKISFIMYYLWTDPIVGMENEDAGKLVKAVMLYTRDGKEPDPEKLGACAAMAFAMIRAKLDEDAEKYKQTCEKRAIAGAAGGAKQKQAKKANANFAKQNKQKAPDNEYDCDCDNDIDGEYIPPYNPPEGGGAPEESPKPKVPETYTARFLRFWEAYPVKKGKGEAAKAFKKTKADDELLEEMLKAIKAQEKSRNWKEGYIPYPATWLNQRRWEDDLSGEKKTGIWSPDAYHYVEGSL